MDKTKFVFSGAKSFFELAAEKKSPNVVGFTSEKGLLVPVKKLEPEPRSETEELDDDFEFTQPEPEARKRKPVSRHIQVFDMKSVDSARDRIKRTEVDQKRRLEPEIVFAAKNDGKREIPKLGKLPNVLRKLEVTFPNFSEAISAIGEEFAMAAASHPSDFRISPLLLDGVPGIGKTAFAQSLAAGFGLPFLKINAGNMQHAASIVGTDSHWANAAPGGIFSLLAEGDLATGVVLLDEVDKLNTSPKYSILPALLELLEPETSRTFRDVSIDVVLDASHLIVLMTSNTRRIVDEALLSRTRIFEVEEPSTEQRISIVKRWAKSIAKQNRSRVKPTIDHEDIERLAGLPMDLRALNRILRSSFGRALLKQSRVLEIDWASLEKQHRSRPIGFAH